MLEPTIKENTNQQDSENDGDTHHPAVQNSALFRGYNRDPTAIDLSKLHLVGNAFAEDGQRFFISGTVPRGFRKRGGLFSAIRCLYLGNIRLLTRLLPLCADFFFKRSVPCRKRCGG